LAICSEKPVRQQMGEPVRKVLQQHALQSRVSGHSYCQILSGRTAIHRYWLSFVNHYYCTINDKY
jgi:hypothetical protein